MLLHMIARKNTPENLLAVIVHVVIAMPGGADVAGRPIPKQTWSHLAFSEATGQKVLVTVPNPFQLLIIQLHRGMRPKFPPMLFRPALQLADFDCGVLHNQAPRIRASVEMLRAIGVILRQ